MTDRDDLLPDVNDLRAIPGEYGLHRFTVYVRVQKWAGKTPGQAPGGARADTPLSDTMKKLVVGGGQNPHVKQLRSKDITTGTPELQSIEFEIGPLTQDYAGGGISPEDVNPDRYVAGSSTVQFVILGPGMPPTGLICVRTDDDFDHPFRVMIRVRSTGRRYEGTLP